MPPRGLTAANQINQNHSAVQRRNLDQLGGGELDEGGQVPTSKQQQQQQQHGHHAKRESDESSAWHSIMPRQAVGKTSSVIKPSAMTDGIYPKSREAEYGKSRHIAPLCPDQERRAPEDFC